MSFIFCPLYKLILNDDIRSRIFIKIKELQFHSEWVNFDLHINISDIEISSINIDDIIKQRNIWKNIAKLSIDLWRDFDYYQQYTLKSPFDDDEYKKRLESLGCVCEEGVLRSVSRPSEEVVQTSVFMYCLYEMMVKEKMGDIVNVIADKFISCVFCDSDIKDCEDVCELCGALKEEREKYQRNIYNGQNKQINNKKKNIKENIDESKINKDEEERRLIRKKEVFLYNFEDKSSQTIVNINNEDNNDENLVNKIFEDEINKYNDNDKLICEGCSFELRKADKSDVEINLSGTNINKHISTNIHKGYFTNEIIVSDNNYNFEAEERKEYSDKHNLDKWKCEICECLNEYTFVNCDACGELFNDREWKCRKCTLKNSCVEDNCKFCGDKNNNTIDTESRYAERSLNNNYKFDLLKKGNNKSKLKTDIEFNKGKWKCGKCGMLHLYNITICNICEGSRLLKGLWKCSQCTLINKCINIQCEACDIINYQLLSKYCEYCKKNKVKIKEVMCEECTTNQYNNNNKVETVRWQCGRTHCREWNINNDDYCHKCQIYRQSSKLRGDSVRVYNKESCVWICVGCYKYNEEYNTKCDCGESRYNKAYCKDCRLLSDGRSKNCDKCHKRFS